MRALKISDPSYELMDDHHGNSLIYREHGFPALWCAGTTTRSTSCI